MIGTIAALARTVIVLLVLLATICGGHCESRDRTIAVQDLRQLEWIRMRDVEGADHLLLVLRALLRVVRDDHDRALVDDLVEELIRRDDLVQRLLERDAVAAAPCRRSLDRRFEGDVDAGGLPDEIEDVAQARLVEHDRRWSRATRG